uniref:Uncharacterized protein n=1 Tax=Promethearchaeum syntrophicum TaxID=2594042 RepID=A0A5B9D641_9ARCH|nr:hypothetical protein DSAG12_00112 [Candidatus Prometheoarchaeum syntrophicum]
MIELVIASIISNLLLNKVSKTEKIENLIFYASFFLLSRSEKAYGVKLIKNG